MPERERGDLNAMFEEVNSLPADDPLRSVQASDGGCRYGEWPAVPVQADGAMQVAGVEREGLRS